MRRMGAAAVGGLGIVLGGGCADDAGGLGWQHSVVAGKDAAADADSGGDSGSDTGTDADAIRVNEKRSRLVLR